jgi:hypothetical protein
VYAYGDGVPGKTERQRRPEAGGGRDRRVLLADFGKLGLRDSLRDPLPVLVDQQRELHDDLLCHIDGGWPVY